MAMVENHVMSYHLESEDLTAVVMKITVFWDITLCSLLNVSRRFGGTYRLHLQDRIAQACFHAGILLGLFYLKNVGGMFHRNVG
jgi:hypothetical protein